ncbi:DUF2493 domain-containing protein [Sphingobium sp. D43FB]|uniref:DUF2493 domain-containing protein n=1 Tax=Sphingobium sp. D43FB TaxID=2017595 RepID=UPI000BB545E5|nr:DUF2493 domain-containing protein [Sphingobium sp. D43FB]PBN43506.1 hypothetical protein SxD43FB_10310 [Sphingobium sp. D43FB]
MTYTTSSSSHEHFAQAFTETVDLYRIMAGEDATNAPMPDPVAVEHATEMLVRTIFDVLQDTRLDSIADRIAWGVVHSLYKVTEQIEGQADKAAMNVKSLIRQADGSEVGTRELEEAQQLCQSLDETRDALACMRDHAAATYLAETGKPWAAPRASLTSSKRTASVVAATDFLAARRQRKIDAHAPQGPVVIFSGGQVWEDHRLLYDRLDAIRARVPGMILATTAQDKGCDAIAAAWAARSGCKLIAFTLNRRLGNRAGFARNEQLLGLRPVEAIVCEGSGLQSHLAREVRKQGIPAHFFRLVDQNGGR